MYVTHPNHARDRSCNINSGKGGGGGGGVGGWGDIYPSALCNIGSVLSQLSCLLSSYAMPFELLSIFLFLYIFHRLMGIVFMCVCMCVCVCVCFIFIFWVILRLIRSIKDLITQFNCVFFQIFIIIQIHKYMNEDKSNIINSFSCWGVWG